MLKHSSREKNNMMLKEIFDNIDHSELDYDHLMMNNGEGSDYDNTLNESLSVSENRLCMKNLERIFNYDYYYFYYGSEKLGYHVYWRVF